MGYQTDIRITTSMTDYSQGLSVIGAFEIIQDAVCDYFADLGIDNPSVRKNYDAFWVFTKNRVDFYKRIEWNEKITVKCHFSRITAATIVTSTAFIKEDGSVAAASSVESCLISRRDNKIIPLKTVEFLRDDLALEHENPFCKFEAKKTGAARYLTVPSTAIDYSMHTNNVEYLRFILCHYTAEQLTVLPIKTIEAHYLKQTYEGDALSIYHDEAEEESFCIFSGDDLVMKVRVVR